MATTAKTVYTFEGADLTVDGLAAVLAGMKVMGCPGTARVILPAKVDVVVQHTLVEGQLNDLLDEIISPQPIAVSGPVRPPVDAAP